MNATWEKEMNVLNAKDVNENKIESYPYKGKPLVVKGVGIRWLSQAGPGSHRNTG